MSSGSGEKLQVIQAFLVYLLKFLTGRVNTFKSKPDMLRDIHTARFKIMLEVNETFLGKTRLPALKELLKSTTLLYFKELEPLLQERQFWAAQGLVVAAQGEYRKALELWAK